MTQTAVEFIEEGIKARQRYWHDQYQQGYQRVLSDIMTYIEEAKQIEKDQLNKACYDGYYREDLYDTRKYYKDTYCEYSGLPSVESYENKNNKI